MPRYIDADRIDWRLIIPTDPTTAEENMIYRARKLVESQPTVDVVRCGESIPHWRGQMDGCLPFQKEEQDEV